MIRRQRTKNAAGRKETQYTVLQTDSFSHAYVRLCRCVTIQGGKTQQCALRIVPPAANHSKSKNATLWDKEIKATICACFTFMDDFLSEILGILKHGITFAVLGQWMCRCPLKELHTLFLCSRSLLFRHLPEWCILCFVRLESAASLFACMLWIYSGVQCNLCPVVFAHVSTSHKQRFLHKAQMCVLGRRQEMNTPVCRDLCTCRIAQAVQVQRWCLKHLNLYLK